MIFDVIAAILLGVLFLILIIAALVVFMVWAEAFDDGKTWAIIPVAIVLGGALCFGLFSLGWSVVR